MEHGNFIRGWGFGSDSQMIDLKTFKYEKSTESIPTVAGTYWVLAKNSFDTVVVVTCSHCANLKLTIQRAQKHDWIKPGLHSYWVEVMPDHQLFLAA
jgi:hypothetical protein